MLIWRRILRVAASAALALAAFGAPAVSADAAQAGAFGQVGGAYTVQESDAGSLRTSAGPVSSSVTSASDAVTDPASSPAANPDPTAKAPAISDATVPATVANTDQVLNLWAASQVRPASTTATHEVASAVGTHVEFRRVDG